VKENIISYVLTFDIRGGQPVLRTTALGVYAHKRGSICLLMRMLGSCF